MYSYLSAQSRPNKHFDRSAERQRRSVPGARCAPAPGQVWRSAFRDCGGSEWRQLWSCRSEHRHYRDVVGTPTAQRGARNGGVSVVVAANPVRSVLRELRHRRASLSLRPVRWAPIELPRAARRFVWRRVSVTPIASHQCRRLVRWGARAIVLPCIASRTRHSTGAPTASPLVPG